jgi:hypothetical protein
MKLKIMALATVAAAAFAAPAFAATQINGPFTDPVPANHNLLLDFDGSVPFGWTWAPTAPAVVAAPGIPGVAAAPKGGSGNFGYVTSAPGGPQTVTLNFAAGLRSVSFLWGSVDGKNQLAVSGTGPNLVITGINVAAPPNGNQANPDQNRRVTIFADPGQKIQSLTFSANNVAYEFDNISGMVPEPSTWMLMIMGFGLIASQLRRRYREGVAAAA